MRNEGDGGGNGGRKMRNEGDGGRKMREKDEGVEGDGGGMEGER